MRFADLPDRGVVAVRGADAVPFLQGLVSNDVAGIHAGEARWAALLTAQGKWLADFFVLAAPDGLLLDCERAQAPMLARLLSRYRLRAKVTVEDVSDSWAVHAAWGGAPPPGAVRDPRHPDAGWRVLRPRPAGAGGGIGAGDIPAGSAPPAPDTPPDDGADAYDRHRLALGLPDGSRDLDAEKTVLLEAGFDELHGVSWTKGCYMGQELTARTKYRGLLKKRLVPVAVSGPMPPRGAPVLRDGAEVGEMRSGRDGQGLALLRIEAARAPALACGEAALTPRIPDWMRLPDA